VGSANGSGVFNEEANLLRLTALSADSMLIVICTKKDYDTHLI